MSWHECCVQHNPIHFVSQQQPTPPLHMCAGFEWRAHTHTDMHACTQVHTHARTPSRLLLACAAPPAPAQCPPGACAPRAGPGPSGARGLRAPASAGARARARAGTGAGKPLAAMGICPPGQKHRGRKAAGRCPWNQCTLGRHAQVPTPHPPTHTQTTQTPAAPLPRPCKLPPGHGHGAAPSWGPPPPPPPRPGNPSETPRKPWNAPTHPPTLAERVVAARVEG